MMATVVQYLPGSHFLNVNQEMEQRWTTYTCNSREKWNCPLALSPHFSLTLDEIRRHHHRWQGRQTRRKQLLPSFLLLHKGILFLGEQFCSHTLTYSRRKEGRGTSRPILHLKMRKSKEGPIVHFRTLTDKQVRVIWPLKTLRG